MKKEYKTWEECMALNEINILKKLNHPNIVRLIEVIRENDELFFIFEYLDSNLYEKIRDRMSKLFSEGTVRNIIYQILQALAYMHQKGYFHRDLKPENILTSGEIVKIADFGLAKEIESRPPFSTYVSTRWYRAPEVILCTEQYGPPIDLWAVGTIMAELYGLTPLFPGSGELDQFFKIAKILGTPTPTTWPDGMKLSNKLKFEFPNFMPTSLKQVIPSATDEAIELISDLLQYDPLKRPSAAEALRYPFFQVRLPPSIVLKPNHYEYIQSKIVTHRLNDEEDYQQKVKQIESLIQSNPYYNNNKKKNNPYLRNARYRVNKDSDTNKNNANNNNNNNNINNININNNNSSNINILKSESSTSVHLPITTPSSTFVNNNNINNGFSQISSPSLSFKNIPSDSLNLLNNNKLNLHLSIPNNTKPSKL